MHGQETWYRDRSMREWCQYSMESLVLRLDLRWQEIEMQCRYRLATVAGTRNVVVQKLDSDIVQARDLVRCKRQGIKTGRFASLPPVTASVPRCKFGCKVATNAPVAGL